MEAFKLQTHTETFFRSLTVENMSLYYPEQGFVFKDLSFDFPLHEVVVFQGPRNSGKSSLLKILSGLSQPTSGTYKVNNQVISELTFDEFLPYRLRMGYGFDFGGLISNLTVYQNLILPLQYHKVKSMDHHDQVMKYINLFGLESVMNERPAGISGGMRKEVCVARAFIMEPELVFLDDPTTGMSSENKRAFLNILEDRLRNGHLKHIFLSTEDPIMIENFATKIMRVYNGEIKIVT
ncbi:MAG: ATP-binding cassette domain-containing protein [Bdellovibrionales bacterium]|nr:ATP-binding cassette domain-containing protein [Bdellovibrionales bacterium]